MEKQNALRLVVGVMVEIFERPPLTFGPETRLFRDTPCESIDLLEIAARLSQYMGRELDDDKLFLRSLRSTLAEREGEDAEAVLAEAYPWLGAERRAAIAGELSSLQPILTLDDMASYLASL